MKKLGVVIFMVIVIGLYAMSIKNAGKDEKNSSTKEETNIGQDISIRLADLSKKIDEEYPSTPKEVIQMHNELMSIGYSSQISQEEISSYVEQIRKLYSEEFKELNPIEEQEEMLVNEIVHNSNDSLIIINSQTSDVIIIQNNYEDEPDMAEVVVKHSTNQGDLIRKYTLIEETDRWKIHGWAKNEEQTVNSEE